MAAIQEARDKNGSVVKKGDNIQITAKKEITAEVLLDQQTQKGEYVFLSFRVENHQPSKDVSVTINGIKNKLSSTDTEYYNNNEIFHYTFAVREGTQKLAVRFGEGDYELRQVSCRVGLVDETKNAALYKNPADLKLSASGNGYAGEVQAETDQWMITSIPFDDSLKIYVDGTQVETVRVNGGFAGARVSKGAHRIELRYQAPGSGIGLGLSAAAAITGGIWVILSRKTSIPQHGGARSKQSAVILTGSCGVREYIRGIDTGKRILLTQEHTFAIMREKEANVSLDNAKRVIFHVDVNSAFLSWEAAYRLHHLGGKKDLREEAAAVGGDMALRHGIILAKSIPAKKYHIKTGETIPEARRKCPNLILVPPNYGLYERCSRAFMDILRQYSPDVEPYSIDEAFIDMTGTESLWGDPVAAAVRLKDQIRDTLGFTVNIGISENKLLAKMASDFQKPDRVHTLWKEEIPEKMWPLPVSDLFFTGRAASRKLFNLGIHSIGDLARADPAPLRDHLKKQGEVIWAFANGKDVSLVQSEPPANKGYGNSTTIPFDVTDASTARLVLLALAETVGARLRAANAQAEVIAVGIKSHDLSYSSHQTTLGNATNITMEIYRWACRLFDELWTGAPIRHLGIHTSRVKDKICMRQLDMFDPTDYEKLGRMDRAVDQIRGRYGNDAVMRAAFAGSPIDHMSGGISREKRTVDYKKIRVE